MAGIFQNNFFLLGKKRQIQRQYIFLQIFRYGKIAISLQCRNNIFFHNLPGCRQINPLKQSIFFAFDFHPDKRPLSAKPHTPCCHNTDFIFNLFLGNNIFNQIQNVIAARRLAAGRMTAVNIAGKSLDFGQFVFGRFMNIKSLV